MKKLIACLLSLALLAGIVPAALAAESTSTEQGKSIKVLSIGEQSTRASVTNYLPQVLEAEGYEDMVVGNLYAVNYSISDYVEEYNSGKGKGASSGYSLDLNRVGYFDYRYNEPLDGVLEEEEWDYVVLTTTPVQDESVDELVASMEEMADIVEKHAPQAKIGWHVNWSYQDGYDTSEWKYIYDAMYGAERADEAEANTGTSTLSKRLNGEINAMKSNKEQFGTLYNGDPATMFTAIAQLAEKVALSGNIDFLVPVGTAVLNAETSFLGDLRADEGEPVVDSANLNETGKLVASYAWYAALTGAKLEDLNFYQAFLFDLSSAERKAVAEAVNNAIKTPYKVTEASAYKTEPTQYNVTVNGTTQKCLPGDTVTITTKALRNASRAFLNWEVVEGNVTLGDTNALTTSFKVPAQDVEVKAVYEAEEEVAGQLKVGFGRGDLTPSGTVNLYGYSDTANRLSNGTRTPEDRLYGNVVAISDGTSTQILSSMDLVGTPHGWVATLGEKVEALTGVPAENIILSGTHTHNAMSLGEARPLQSTPYITSDPEGEFYWYYLEWMEAMTQACVEAVEDLKPVTATKTKSVTIPGMNWMRHWRGNGGVMQGVRNTAEGGYKGPFRETDQELQLIRFVREDAKDVVLINWQAHNHSVGGDSARPDHYMFSADFAGYVYRYLEENEPDCNAIIFFGASGNVHASLVSHTSVQLRWGYTGYYPEAYGPKLGSYIMEAMKNMTVVETGKIQRLRQNFIGIHNRGAVPTREIEQNVVAIGDSIAFATAAYEMMDSNGMDIKNASPYDTTFMLTNSQYANHYMASWQVIHYPILGGGTPYEAGRTSFHFLNGTAEDLADGLISMLNIMYEN